MNDTDNTIDLVRGGVVTGTPYFRDIKVRPALCLDLDGTVRRSKSNPSGFIKNAEDIELFPGVEATIHEYKDRGYLIFGISNQGGVAFGYKTYDDVMDELDTTLHLFERNPFTMVQMCFNHPDAPEGSLYRLRSLLRKPYYGMLVLLEASAVERGYFIDWDKSIMVGDRDEDMKCAREAHVEFQWAWKFFGRCKSCYNNLAGSVSHPDMCTACAINLLREKIDSVPIEEFIP